MDAVFAERRPHGRDELHAAALPTGRKASPERLIGTKQAMVTH